MYTPELEYGGNDEGQEVLCGKDWSRVMKEERLWKGRRRTAKMACSVSSACGFTGEISFPDFCCGHTKYVEAPGLLLRTTSG